MPNAVDSDLYDPIDGKPSLDNRDSLYFILGERPENLSPRYVSMDNLATLITTVKKHKDTHWSYVMFDDTVQPEQVRHTVDELKKAGVVSIRSTFDPNARFY